MISRRVFLKNGAFALVSLGFAPSFLARTVAAASAARAKQLIAIFQRGAVDGLSMVVPFGERDYYRARPSIAIPRPSTARRRASISTGSSGSTRGSGAQAALGPRQLAIVHACGSPDGTRSHFDAQDYMETAHAGREEHAGRLAEPVPAGARARGRDAVPRRGADAAAAAHAAGHSARAGDEPDRRSSASAAGRRRRCSASFESRIRRSGRRAAERHRRARRSTPSRCSRAPTRRSYQPENGAEYPRSPRSAQALRQIAQLIKADVGLEVAFADVGGWDTHVNQGAAQGQLATRLDDFARGIAALVARSRRPHGRHRHADDVASSDGRWTKTATAAPTTATATR